MFLKGKSKRRARLDLAKKDIQKAKISVYCI